VTPWRRNVFAVTAASFVGSAGFTLVMPFLPLYIRQLGTTGDGEIALWTGLTLGVTPALTALCAPVWGRVADRFGDKLMVERALVSFVVVMSAMAFVTRTWHLFALRAALGLFAGYGALTLSMAARSAPREQMVIAIGTVQTAQRLGPTLGPVIGGILAPFVGLRNAFLCSAMFYALGFVVVLTLYHETDRLPSGAPEETGRVTFGNLLAFENFLLLILVIFGLQMVERSLGPVLPLYIGRLGFAPERVPIISGLLFSAVAFGAAFGHHLASALLKRFSARVVIALVSLIASGALATFTTSYLLAVLVIAMAVFGVCIGIAMTTAFTAAGSVVPQEVHATAFGVLTSASLAGLALSPVLSGLVGAQSIRVVFWSGVVALVLVAILVRRVMVERALVIEAPPTVEES
jgi:DHA1 family multidrug resistance protein-like MFS transporter